MNNLQIKQLVIQYLYENNCVETAKLLDHDKSNSYISQLTTPKLLFNYINNDEFKEALLLLHNNKLNVENQEVKSIIELYIKIKQYLSFLSSKKINEAMVYLRTNLSNTILISYQNIISSLSSLLFSNNIKEDIRNNELFSIIDDNLSLSNEIEYLLNSKYNDGSYGQLDRLLTSYNNFTKEYNSLYNTTKTTKANKNLIINKQLNNIQKIDYEICLNNNKEKHLNSDDFSQVAIADKYNDEIWNIEFSQSKMIFCVIGRTSIATIYHLDAIPAKDEYFKIQSTSNNIICISNFSVCKKPITNVSFSPDDKYIAFCSTDNFIRLFTIEGEEKLILCNHSDIVSSIRFISNEYIVSAGIDRKIILYKLIHNTNNSLSYKTYSHVEDVRIRDIHLTTSKKSHSSIMSNLNSLFENYLIVIPASSNYIITYSYRVVDNEDSNVFELVLKPVFKFSDINRYDQIISSCITNDKGSDNYFMVNLNKINPSINLYNLNDFSLINKYYGHTQSNYVIGCCFGGEDNEYIISGSEDYKIYIWHRRSSIHMFIIQGHTGSVNMVKMPIFGLLFSVSDDHTLRIWSKDIFKIHDEVKDTRKRIDSYISMFSKSDTVEVRSINQASIRDSFDDRARNDDSLIEEDEENYDEHEGDEDMEEEAEEAEEEAEDAEDEDEEDS